MTKNIITYNRNFFDMMKDGNTNYLGRVKSQFAPTISVNVIVNGFITSNPNLLIFYYDKLNSQIRINYGRDPVMLYNSYIDIPGITEIVSSVTNTNSFNYFLFAISSDTLFASYDNFNKSIPLATINSNVTNLKLKKFGDNYSFIFLLSIGNSIYEINCDTSTGDILYNLIVSHYDGIDFDGYLFNQKLYLVYTSNNKYKIIEYTMVFPRAKNFKNISINTQKKIEIDNKLKRNPRIIKINNTLYLFCIYKGTINYAKINPNFPLRLVDSKIKAFEIKLQNIQSKIYVTYIDKNKKLSQVIVHNNVFGKPIQISNAQVLNTAYDCENVNGEQYICYIDINGYMRQVWNPINEIEISITDALKDLAIINPAAKTSLYPNFSTSITDYIISDVIDKNLYIISMNFTNTVEINAYTNQLIKIKSKSGSYYIKIISNDMTIPNSSILNNKYISGYYPTANTFGVGVAYYWNIYDKNGIPVWYRRGTTDSNNPQICSLFLGNDTNKVVTDIFDTHINRSVINIDTLEETNFFPANDSRYNSATNWNVHEALEIKLPSNRKNNMIHICYNIGLSEFYIQEQKPNLDVVFELYSEDYFNYIGGDYFHTNSVDVHPVTGDILISFRQASAIACFNYKTKNLDWVIDSNNSLQPIAKNPELTKYLTINDTTHNGFVYTGTSAQHDARWVTLIPPLNPGNLMISAYDDQSFTGAPARGVVFEIDVSGNTATYRSGVYADGGSSGYMGSYRIVKENTSSISHVVDWVQQHPNLGEYKLNSDLSQTKLFEMDLPGDLYRITKATPSQLLINSMRKTSGLPYFTS